MVVRCLLEAGGLYSGTYWVLKQIAPRSPTGGLREFFVGVDFIFTFPLTRNNKDNCGLVLDATFPPQLQEVHGLGKHGGDVVASCRAGFTSRADGLIFNSSRDILYASAGEDYAEKAGEAAQELDAKVREEIHRRPEAVAL